MEVLKEAAQLGVNLYEIHQQFVKSFEPQWRSDENVMLLLSAIALFTPERSNVVHKDVVKFEQVNILRFYRSAIFYRLETLVMRREVKKSRIEREPKHRPFLFF